MRILLACLCAALLSGCAVREVGTFYRLAPHTSPSAAYENTPKDIFVTIDGTSNTLTARTNAGRLFEFIDQSAGMGRGRQIVTYYAEGVGSGDIRPFGLLTGAGMNTDIKNAYAFLTQVWSPGDRIYLSGFSRGAYGVRALGGLLYSAGIPDLHKHTPAERREIVDDLFDAHKTSGGGPEMEGRMQHRMERIVAVLAEHNLPSADVDSPSVIARSGGFTQQRSQVVISAIAVWDTVAAIGRPDGLEDPTEARDEFLLTTCNVENAFQALSLDDNRAYSFTPIFIDGTAPRAACNIHAQSMAIDTTVEEVWFAGAHSDVGGTYAHGRMLDGALPGVSLNWMLSQLTSLDAMPLSLYHNVHEDRLSVVHDSEASLRAFYRQSRKPMLYTRYAHRRDDALPKVHASVFDRLEYIYLLDQREPRCGPDYTGDALGLLCARELTSHGLVPELIGNNCLATTDWGYRLTDGWEGRCVEMVGQPAGWTHEDMQFPADADGTDAAEAAEAADGTDGTDGTDNCPIREFLATYFTGTPLALKDHNVCIPLPRHAPD